MFGSVCLFCATQEQWVMLDRELSHSTKIWECKGSRGRQRTTDSSVAGNLVLEKIWAPPGESDETIRGEM